MLHRSACRGALALAGLTTLLAAQVPLRPQRCLTPSPDPISAAAAQLRTQGDCTMGSTNPLARYDRTSVYRVAVVFHVIQSTSGSGLLSNHVVQGQIDILNEDFRALTGTNGSAGADTGIEFYLATVDPAGNPTTGITRSTNDTWFRDRGGYYNTLAWDTNRYLNIYSVDLRGALGYVPEIPQAGNLVGTPADRVVMEWRTIGRNAPIGHPFNLGRTTTHEVGHYFGLLHTFEGGCGSAALPNSTGDLIGDTGPHSFPNYGCPTGSRGCGSTDPIDNYMNYTDDSCMARFTLEQARRMRCTLEFWRPQLATACAIATVANRSAPLHADSYVATAPVLGAAWSATIDTAATGHTMAQVFGAFAPAALPLLGETLLVDFGGTGNVFPLPAAGGPLARIGFSLPLDEALCGITLYTQAVQFGGTPGFTLSNAQDLLLGFD